MYQLFRIERHQVATFGGGVTAAAVSPYREGFAATPCREALGKPFADHRAAERLLRYYGDCLTGQIGQTAGQRELAEVTFARLCAGEPVTTPGGVVQVLKI